jgi:hypothetical protein
MRSARTRGQLGCHLTFSHPDYTVGPGLSPDRARHTASSRARRTGNHLPSATPPIGNYLTLGEIHPAPKVVLLRIQLLLLYAIVKGMSSRLDLEGVSQILGEFRTPPSKRLCLGRISAFGNLIVCLKMRALRKAS